MGFFGQQPYVKPRAPREKKRKCEVIVEKTPKGVRKKIAGDCTPQELKALGAVSESTED